MKRIIILLSALMLSISCLFALEVNKKELQKVNEMDTVEFISYTGPHKVIDTAEAIRNIGGDLGKVVGRTPEEFLDVGNNGRYYVIHAVDTEEKGKLDADILFLGSNAGVDHIKNLRRIIGTYLEKAYGYSRRDADTLAVFVTVYNAVYRGNLTDLKNIYKTVVTNNLSADNCGLSTNYKDWPGKSEIIIPLRDLKDVGISTVDTTVISDTKVVESMKEDDDKGIDNRKQMVDIKEREAENASEKAKDSQKTAVEEQKKLNEEIKKTEEKKKQAETINKKAEEAKKEVENKKKDVEDKKQVAEEKKQTAKENPKDKKAQAEAKTAEEAVKKAEDEVKKAEETADQKQEEADKVNEEVKEQEQKKEEQAAKTEEAKEQAKEHQEFADKKQTEAQSDRKEIAKDQGIIVKEEIAKTPVETEHGLVIADKSDMLSRIVEFDITNGKVVKNSPVTVIRNRTMYRAGDYYIAIAGENSGNGTIKLVLIDGETLELVSESAKNVAADSVLVQDGDSYYCVVIENGKNYVAKFDENLSLKLKSDVEVLSCTPITFTNSCIVVTGASGAMKLLRKSDLKEIGSESESPVTKVTPVKGKDSEGKNSSAVEEAPVITPTVTNPEEDEIVEAPVITPTVVEKENTEEDLPAIEEAPVVDVAPVTDISPVEAEPVEPEILENINSEYDSDLFAK